MFPTGPKSLDHVKADEPLEDEEGQVDRRTGERLKFCDGVVITEIELCRLENLIDLTKEQRILSQ